VVHVVVILKVSDHRKELSHNLRLNDQIRHNGVGLLLCLAISLIRYILEVLARINHEEESLIGNYV